MFVQGNAPSHSTKLFTIYDGFTKYMWEAFLVSAVGTGIFLNI